MILPTIIGCFKFPLAMGKPANDFKWATKTTPFLFLFSPVSFYSGFLYHISAWLPVYAIVTTPLPCYAAFSSSIFRTVSPVNSDESTSCSIIAILH
jgi:hypothetical protein